ncbi:hypothetical protein OFAG_01215 [Oxalobacter formigenes HOxBLS]|uniref:UPF0246 protein OFAG_01215 n=2 Tax=Oxalobacter paraformigenes TaxID=556268 RepID=C3X4C6_9BURK|nr:hypothetical protein OFAG_01215 [Oxalobacter paraformigenes]
MLMILSPSKRQRFSGSPVADPVQENLFSRPEWIARAGKVAQIMKSCAPHELARILHASDTIAATEAGHFNEWSVTAAYPQARPALLTFDGDVYRALDAKTLPEKAQAYLNGHLRILSALYGILKPFDLIQPYRLGFGVRAVRPDGGSLYDYWREPVTESLNRALEATGDKVLVNLASSEFARAVDVKALAGKMITPVFQEMRGGNPRVVGLYAKQARGLMARYAAERGVTEAEQLKSFDYGHYVFHAASSKDTLWVFRR